MIFVLIRMWKSVRWRFSTKFLLNVWGRGEASDFIHGIYTLLRWLRCTIWYGEKWLPWPRVPRQNDMYRLMMFVGHIGQDVSHNSDVKRQFVSGAVYLKKMCLNAFFAYSFFSRGLNLQDVGRVFCWLAIVPHTFHQLFWLWNEGNMFWLHFFVITVWNAVLVWILDKSIVGHFFCFVTYWSFCYLFILWYRFCFKKCQSCFHHPTDLTKTFNETIDHSINLSLHHSIHPTRNTSAQHVQSINHPADQSIQPSTDQSVSPRILQLIMPSTITQSPLIYWDFVESNKDLVKLPTEKNSHQKNRKTSLVRLEWYSDGPQKNKPPTLPRMFAFCKWVISARQGQVQGYLTFLVVQHIASSRDHLGSPWSFRKLDFFFYVTYPWFW